MESNTKPCDGIYGSSCNKNNKCNYPDCKTIEQILKDYCSLDIRGGQRLDNDIFNDYLVSTTEPYWVCIDCSIDRNADFPKGHQYTIHPDECGICLEKKQVTQPRDLGLDRYKIRVINE